MKNELLKLAIEDMKILARQAHYQPCETCRYTSFTNTVACCLREEKCPNCTFPYWEWRYAKKFKEITLQESIDK